MWRYLSHDRLVDLLTTGELFFTHLPRLSDGFEGALSERTRARLFSFLCGQYHDAALAASSVADYENHRDDFYVNCWHMNDAESYLMWRAYGDRGFAIHTTLERLQAAFDGFAGLIEGRTVDYVDFSRDAFVIGNVFTAVTKKGLPYRDEREFRLLFWKRDPANSAVAVQLAGVRVRVDLSMLIESIHVSPQVRSVPDDVARLIEETHLPCSLTPSAVREREVSNPRAV